jgi:catechol 2,3-dioxygenase
MSNHFSPRLAHVGVCCIDIDKMIDFYTSVFDLRLTDKGPGKNFPYMLAFLSSSPDQHHELALAQSREAGTVSTIMQLSFKIKSLDELREIRRRALSKGATKLRPSNHGNALSIYFFDPEENMVEVYLDTPWYVAQPHGDPLDLDKSDQEIWDETKKIVEADPTFMTTEQWAEKVFGSKKQ